MKALYPALALATLAFTACVDDESYDDWSPAQQNENATDDQLANVKFSAAQVSAIDFATLEDVDSVTIFTVSNSVDAVDASALKTTYKVILGNSSEEIEASTGKVATETLRSAIETAFGKAPVQRDLAATVVAYNTWNGISARNTSDITITATLTAPEIESAYYYIGATNGWSETDQTYKFTRADESVSVYDDPVFTCVVPAPFTTDETTGVTSRADNWFKIAPASAYELEDFWSGKLLGSATDGDESLKVSLINEGAQACKQPATDGALKYKITLNMMEYTMTIEPISYDEFIYVPGNGQGWNPETAPALRSANADGIYVGYAVMNGEFKFTKARNWNDGEYNTDSFSTYGDGFEGTSAGGNVKCTGEAGIYYLTADVASGSLSGVLCNFGLIGPAQAGGWDSDTDMTFDAATNTYTWTGDLAAGEMKFRVNDGWDINLGGSLDDLVANGDNITIAEAGNYTVVLNVLITSDGGKMTATITKN